MAFQFGFELLVETLDGSQSHAVELERADVLVVAAGIKGPDEIGPRWGTSESFLLFVVPLIGGHLRQLPQ